MSLVNLAPACYSDVVFIARNLRKMDAEEILPLIWGGKPENLAAITVAAGGWATVALSGVEPVAAFGVIEAKPKFWNVWMYATDSWPKVALSVTRNIKREIIPTLVSKGAVRADCWSMAGHTTAHRWLECLGAIREATLEDYGASRKVFHCYSWTISRLEREGYVHIPKAPQDAPGAGSASPPGPAPSPG